MFEVDLPLKLKTELYGISNAGKDQCMAEWKF